jgi:hypothetical protein
MIVLARGTDNVRQRMSGEFHRQFAELRRKALRPFPKVSSLRYLFTLVELPSFDASGSWTVCATMGADRKFSVHKKTWRSNVDVQVFASPIERLRHPKELLPTIEEKVSEISAAEISSYEASLARLQFRPYLAPSTSVRLDGTNYEFWTDTIDSSFHLAWHEDGPEEWRVQARAIRCILDDLKQKEL